MWCGRFPKNAITDYWECVKTVAAQLLDSDRVQEIYQNMLPAWESTKEDDRHYSLRKQGLEAMRAYLDGTYSVFGLEKPAANANGTSKPGLAAIYHTERTISECAGTGTGWRFLRGV